MGTGRAALTRTLAAPSGAPLVGVHVGDCTSDLVAGVYALGETIGGVFTTTTGRHPARFAVPPSVPRVGRAC